MNETIRKLREQHNYSQTYLALCLKVSRQMYIKYENGEVEPPVHVIKALCKLYDVSYDVIIDGRSEETALPDMVADPAPAYCAKDEGSAYCYPISFEGYKEEDSLSEKIQRLSKDSFKMLVSFVNFLLLEDKDKPPTIIPPKIKSKKAFFDLAGKIDIDPNAVMELREISKI